MPPTKETAIVPVTQEVLASALLFKMCVYVFMVFVCTIVCMCRGHLWLSALVAVYVFLRQGLSPNLGSLIQVSLLRGDEITNTQLHTGFSHSSWTQL